jgi:FHS family L-fucose permease-like MFS transporter
MKAIGVASFVIRFTQHALPGTPEKAAANYLKWHLFGFMIGRFAGYAVMKRVAPSSPPPLPCAQSWRFS